MIDLLLAQAPVPGLDFALQGLYDDLSAACFDVFEALLPIAYTLAFLGLLLRAYQVGLGDISGIWKHILLMAIIAVVMPAFPDLIISAQSLFGIQLLEELEMDPISIVETFFDDFADNTVQQIVDPFTSVGGFLNAINPMEVFSQIVENIGNFLMILAAVVGYILILFVYIVQVFVLYIGIGGAPIFFGMLMWETTRQTGIKYIIGLVGITFWPLGWGLGLIFLDALMNSEAIAEMLGGIFIAYSMFAPFVILIQALLALIWLIITAFYAPKIVSKAVTTGAQIGTGMVGEAIGMTTATAGAAIGAAATVGGAAVGAAAGGPVGAAIGGSIGGAAGGAAGGAVSSAGNAARPDS